MHVGKLVFAQMLEFAPWHTFRRLVGKYRGDCNVRRFSCLDQFLCMAFAQLTYRESLRDIEACLRAQPEKLYHLGFRGMSVAALTIRHLHGRLEPPLDIEQHPFALRLTPHRSHQEFMIDVVVEPFDVGAEALSGTREGAEMSRKRFTSVWDAIEDSATEAASMKLRAELASEIIERMHERKLTQVKAAELIGVTQPRVSDLMRGRLDLFSLDALVDMADRIGLRTRMVVSPKRAA